MRLTIKNETNGNGANGTNRVNDSGDDTNGNGTHGRHLVDRVVRSTGFLRRVKGSAGEIGEALLQLLSGTRPYVPKLRVRETTDAISISAALPGVDEDSVQLTFDGRVLRVTGTKTKLRERTRRKYRRVLKVYRTFERAIPIYCDVDRDKSVATLNHDLLRIRLTKASPPRKSVTPAPISVESKAANGAAVREERSPAIGRTAE